MGASSSTSLASVTMNGSVSKTIQSEVAKHQVVMYSKTFCPYCTMAKDVFKELKVSYHLVELDMHPEGSQIQDALREITGARTQDIMPRANPTNHVAEMRSYYAYDALEHDPIQKLWIQIDQLHLSLMDMDHNAAKLDHKLKLEGCMKDYLSAVPLERRFYFQATNDVLYQTVLSKRDDFNPVRTALAWDTINTYASNLLTQPWRREFRELRLYCGMFKHQVEGHLMNSTEILNLLGYRSASGFKLVLEGPVDPDRVARVARDCLLAKTECEILRFIWEGVSSKYPTSWEEIVTFRRDYISTPEQATRAILYRRREEEYYKQYGPPIHCPSDQRIPLSYSDPQVRYPAPHAPYNPYPYGAPILPHPVPSGKENGHRDRPPDVLPQYPPHQYLQPAPPTRPTRGSKLPEYDQNMNQHKHHLLDSNVEDVGIKSPLIPLSVLQLSQEDVKTTDEQLSFLSLNERPKKGEQTPSTGSVQYSGGHTIWDYVYRDLESQGYSKDLGERGDLLVDRVAAMRDNISCDEVDSTARRDQNSRSAEPTRVGTKHRADHYKPGKENVKNGEDRNQVDSCTRPTPDDSKSSAEQSKKPEIEQRIRQDLQSFESSTKVVQGVVSRVNGKQAKMPPENDRAEKLQQMKDAQKSNAPDLGEFDPIPPQTVSRKRWECHFCTYLNASGNLACEICGKSKDLEPETETQVVGGPPSGGKECWKCTLVNSKEERICIACGASLEGSPTYI